MKELQTKTTTKIVRLWRTLESWLTNPGFAHLIGSLRYLGLGFVLAGAGVFEMALPIGCAYIATAGNPIFALAGLLGSSVGYLYFWGVSGGFQCITLGVLIFATVCTVNGSNLGSTNWFLPLLTSCMAALVGLIFLIQLPITLELTTQYILQVCASGGMVYGLRMAKKKEKSGYTLFFLGCCVAGFGGMTLVGDLNFGHAMGFFLLSGSLGTAVALPLATVLGLALDCAGRSGFPFTALFVATALLCQIGTLSRRPIGQLLFLVATTMATIFLEPPILELVPVAVVMVFCGLVVPVGRFAGWGNQRYIATAQVQMEEMSQVMGRFSQQLTSQMPKERKVALSTIFDLAAAEVCGNCPLWSQCWKQKGSDTFHLFCAAAPVMIERGQVVREDFPPSFANNCTDFSRLLTHINTGLAAISARKKHNSHLAEVRVALAEQYAFLSEYWDVMGQELGVETGGKLRFSPEIAVKTVKKIGNEVAGDYGTSFSCGHCHHCALLVDGMGSGQAAAEEGILAVDTLRGMLQAGMPPAYGLQMLNHFYILRGNTCFSTIDLLWMDLSTGVATLYKWGAAPSYCKGRSTYKLGSVTPPAGLGVGEKHRPQTVELTMEKGQTVILLTDGIDLGAVDRLIGGWRVCPPQELANAILEEAKSTGEDDMTAVIVTLRHRSSDF